MTELALLGVVLAAVSLVRGRIAQWPLTGPMLYVAAGIALGPDGLGVFDLTIEDESVILLAELTLALLLFSDAARIDTMRLRTSFGLPARLLGIGLPLTIALGTLMTALLLTDRSWAEAALVAAILAPTDAALGQAVVANERVPLMVRQALTVESGLNDGLVVPVIGLFAVIAAGEALEGSASLVSEAAREVGIGVAIGVGAGLLVAFLCQWAAAHQWTDTDGLRLVTFGGALAAFALSVTAGGNGFIAAFTAGLVLHVRSGEQASHRSELAEDIGQIGASATFVVFGAVMVVPAFEHLSWAIVLCAVGTLTVGRMLPVAIATAGTGLKRPTKLFLGWFGPRGLASMLFGLLIVAERGQEVDDVFAVITLVVLASVVLHGLSAAPGAQRYANWFDQEHDGPDEMMEAEPVHPVRLRGQRHQG